MDIKTLVNITERGWALPILAEFATGTPGRQATLINATGANRNAFADSMAHLITLELVERNTGHGHPLRPEFRLSDAGQKAAQMATRIVNAASEPQQPALRRRWTVPLLAFAVQPRAFGGLRRNLAPITDRALSLNLKHLQSLGWMARKVEPDATPPRALYQAIGQGAVIARAVTATQP